jgi:O-antigen/teichoic acid export membrane protein
VKLGVLLGYGLPLYLAAILAVLLGQYQNMVLAYFANNTQIGNFNAAWNFNSLLMILIYPITIAIFPMFSKMDPENQSDLARAFGLAVKYASLVLIPSSIAVMVFSRDLVHVTYGSSYTLAPQYLIILSTLYLLTGLGGTRDSILGSFFYGVAQTGAVLKMSVLTLAIYLPLGLALTWVWGPFGLLIAYVLSAASSTVYGVRQASAKFGARPDVRASGRVLLASLGAAIPTIVLIQLGGMATGIVNLTIGGPLYLVVYLTLAPVLGAVDKSDIINLRTILCRRRIVARLANPVFDYEAKLLSAMGRD